MFFWLTLLGSRWFFKCIHFIVSTQSICQELVNCHTCVIISVSLTKYCFSVSIETCCFIFKKSFKICQEKCLLHRTSRTSKDIPLCCTHSFFFLWNNDCLPITTQFLYILAFSCIRLKKTFWKKLLFKILTVYFQNRK